MPIARQLGNHQLAVRVSDEMLAALDRIGEGYLLRNPGSDARVRSATVRSILIEYLDRKMPGWSKPPATKR